MSRRPECPHNCAAHGRLVRDDPPPPMLDGALVLCWASSDTPFFLMPCGTEPPIPIYGIAICSYADGQAVYRFSCDAAWDVVNDTDFSSVEEAVLTSSGQYDISKVIWNRLL